ncbi:hypothetical protein SB00610_04307 [Klebsiella quasipneumoniae subsp. similipneumoniae]|nr:hypothetical protein SB00610_04307 [Klebsiella quasipneumoniae subsp. similipneumoniae]
MERLGDHPRAGGGKGVTVGDRAAEDVKFTLIHLTGGLRAAQHLAGKAVACQTLEIGQRLRGESFVHIDKREIRQRQASALQRQRRGPCGPQQHILPDIDGGKGIAAQITQRRQTQLFGPRLGHQDHRRRAIRQRRAVGGGNGAMFTVEGRT